MCVGEREYIASPACKTARFPAISSKICRLPNGYIIIIITVSKRLARGWRARTTLLRSHKQSARWRFIDDVRLDSVNYDVENEAARSLTDGNPTTRHYAQSSSVQHHLHGMPPPLSAAQPQLTQRAANRSSQFTKSIRALFHLAVTSATTYLPTIR